MSASDPAATYVLENLRPRFEAEGYRVFLHPSSSLLPPFMAGYRPDAIAVSPKKKIAIEVVPPRDPEKLNRLQDLIRKRDDWELRLVRVVNNLPAAIDAASRPAIDRAIAMVSDLKNGGHPVPALIMGWAAVEAIGRALEPDRYGRPQTPGRLVEFFAHEGYLDPDESDFLQSLIPLQNTAVHGGLDAAVSEQALDQFIAILEKLAPYIPSVP
jgi:hypothetical protein